MQLIGCLGIETIAALTAALREPAERQRRTRRSSRTHRPCELEQSGLLKLCVVEVAKDTLKPLQWGQHAFEIVRVVERRRDIDQVAQFLRADADIMQLGRIRMLVDCLRAPSKPLAQPPRAAGHHLGKLTCGIGRSRGECRWLRQKPLPGRE